VISAEEARKLTEANLSGPGIEPYLKVLDSKIRITAQEGKSRIDPVRHIRSIRMIAPSKEQWISIKKHYTQKGFKWIYHPDTDDQDPRISSETELSW